MSQAHAMLSTLGNLYNVVTQSRISEVVFHFDRVSSEYAAWTDTAVWLGGINPLEWRGTIHCLCLLCMNA